MSRKRSPGVIATLWALPFAVLAGAIAWSLLGHAAAQAEAKGPVTMAAPSLAADAKQACLAFIAKLPAKIRTLDQRSVTTGAEQNAAYGSPAITVACGGPGVGKIDPTSTIYPMSGVCWYAAKTATGSVWTTLDRAYPVQVTVPTKYDSPGTWVTEFRDALVASIPVVKTEYDC
jgi:Protein of unknown function (DUF3515)